jgi:hypothetical protein
MNITKWGKRKKNSRIISLKKCHRSDIVLLQINRNKQQNFLYLMLQNLVISFRKKFKSMNYLMIFSYIFFVIYHRLIYSIPVLSVNDGKSFYFLSKTYYLSSFISGIQSHKMKVFGVH